MRRLLVVVLVLMVAACTVPNKRDDLTLRRTAARADEISSVLERYREVRNAAVSLQDAKPLSTVESDAVLAIDSGTFEVAERLSRRQDLPENPSTHLLGTFTPEFTSYPLWFVAKVRDDVEQVDRIQVFERQSPIDPWLLVAGPRTVVDVALPGVRIGPRGAAMTVKPDNGKGIAMSPQAAATAYAQALADPKSKSAGLVIDDDFRTQMAETKAQNSQLKGVTFSQAWAAEEVRHALRTTDGGALVWVTLLRRDTYKVPSGRVITWPDGSPQKAFLSAGIQTSGTLRYYHQVLLYLPGGDGKPRALGALGGVVGADGI